MYNKKAFKRARQQGDFAIAKKAATRLNKIRKRKGKEPVGQD